MQDQIGPAAPDEQGVAQTVQVLDGLRGHGFFASQGDEQAFRTAADGSGDVQFGVQTVSTGQHEAAQGRQIFIHGVDLALELFDFGRGDAGLFRMNVLGFGGEDRAEVEQLMLDAADHGGKQADARIVADLLLAGNERETDEGVQLVDGTVTIDTQRILGDALAAGEAGLAGIAALGVDAI